MRSRFPRGSQSLRVLGREIPVLKRSGYSWKSDQLEDEATGLAEGPSKPESSSSPVEQKAWVGEPETDISSVYIRSACRKPIFAFSSDEFDEWSHDG